MWHTHTAVQPFIVKDGKDLIQDDMFTRPLSKTFSQFLFSLFLTYQSSPEEVITYGIVTCLHLTKILGSQLSCGNFVMMIITYLSLGWDTEDQTCQWFLVQNRGAGANWWWVLPSQGQPRPTDTDFTVAVYSTAATVIVAMSMYL